MRAQQSGAGRQPASAPQCHERARAAGMSAGLRRSRCITPKALEHDLGIAGDAPCAVRRAWLALCRRTRSTRRERFTKRWPFRRASCWAPLTPSSRWQSGGSRCYVKTMSRRPTSHCQPCGIRPAISRDTVRTARDDLLLIVVLLLGISLGSLGVGGVPAESRGKESSSKASETGGGAAQQSQGSQFNAIGAYSLPGAHLQSA